ncbi:MAG: lipid II flippase MurJ [Terracidiphilus sp.]|jgi:putative peptidoglycan lipid II flippase
MPSVTPIAASTRFSTVHRGILRAVISVGAAGIFVKLIATAKEIGVASVYGRSDAMDAFLAAALIPSLLVNLISESMNQALVPTLVRVREQEGRDRAQQLLSSSMLSMCLLLGLASALMALLAHGFFPLIASNFSPAKLALSIRLFYGLLPIVLLTGIATNGTAILNTLDRFALPALAPAVISISVLLGALFLGSRFGIWAMVYATLAGSLLHVIIVAWMMEAHGYTFRLRWHGMNEATREVAGQYGPVLLSSVVASSGLLVDQSMAAMLPAGSVSALVYANRFVSVVLTLLAGAVSTAIVPYFSRMIAHRDWAGCSHTVYTWVRLTALVSIPISILLIAGARPLVRIAYQHGRFGPHDTAIVATVLAMYAVQIPFYVTSRVYYRLIVAMRRTDLVLYCGLLNLGLDIVLNLVLMHWFGVAGIALATSLWTVSTFFYLWYWSRKLLARASAQEAAA